jgi:hypothetical protein
VSGNMFNVKKRQELENSLRISSLEVDNQTGRKLVVGSLLNDLARENEQDLTKETKQDHKTNWNDSLTECAR